MVYVHTQYCNAKTNQKWLQLSTQGLIVYQQIKCLEIYKKECGHLQSTRKKILPLNAANSPFLFPSTLTVKDGDPCAFLEECKPIHSLNFLSAHRV